MNREQSNRQFQFQCLDEQSGNLASRLQHLETLMEEEFQARASLLDFVDTKTAELVSLASGLLFCIALFSLHTEGSKEEIKQTFLASGAGSLVAGILSKIASCR